MVDGWHPLIDDIQDRLHKELQLALKKGYSPDLACVFHPFHNNADMKMVQLWRHSEKLAIGLGLIKTKPNSTLYISNNLRVCVDCHTAIKHIARNNNRNIVVRDANRFHHFASDGSCSCNDYW